MIARTWHGKVPRAKGDAYYTYLQQTGLADYQHTPGNRGVQVLRRDEADYTHFLLITLWDSVEALQAFAGADYQTARYYPEDAAFLVEFEPVYHYEVLVRE
ncbi:Antibiotic biosynthesis monooxygenase [Catalinimonas alkaloidigena]|uniref:Antibiotic biosynthesis monooxygenase n=1 Tax=Catalinimonas alkaloidigena TaxID=1075417 RepID=A0A1G9DJG6_9BACT|nr:antibiotic biosynthesis monooxygenase [Catalinimonas alkaloidigena]SDK63895.1 Antibiotic biosynthesis monooxygenase [Catalinimonas alkaloidigena]